MRSDGSIPRALRSPRIAALALALFPLLAAPAVSVVAGDDAPRAKEPTPAATAAGTTTELVLGTPIPPAGPTDAERGVGLASLDANAGTVAGLRSDGRILVRTGDAERVVAPPPDSGEFRALAIAGDGVPVAVTTRGRLVLLEERGVARLPLAVQRSAKPAAIPGSKDLVLGSESGTVRRLVRDDGEPRLEEVVPSGDAPIGALAAAADRVVYARLDGVVLEAAFAGGAPRELARPSRTVRELRVVGTRTYLVAGGRLVVVGEAPAGAPPTQGGAANPAPTPSTEAEARAVALSQDGALAALVVDDTIEVRRLGDGVRVATRALAPRSPTALAFDADGRTLLVATRSDARPWRIAIETRALPAR